MDTALDIIRVEQLPIISERLHEIKAQITAEAESLTGLECTEESLKFVKNKRAEFNKLFSDFESKRKGVKNAVMAPYNEFETVYKECVTDVFKSALAVVDGKINGITLARVNARTEGAKAYFGELKKLADIEWLEFEALGIKVTASAGDSTIKRSIEEAVNKIFGEVQVIKMQEHPEEVLFEYKKTLNLPSAIQVVAERHRALDGVCADEPAERTEQTAPADEDDILGMVLKDVSRTMPAPEVPFEEPKKEHRFVFSVTDDELIELLKAIERFDYRIE